VETEVKLRELVCIMVDADLAASAKSPYY